MLQFFALGTIWFWLLLIFTISIVTWFIERDDNSGGYATMFLLITFVLYYLLGLKEQFNYILYFIFYNPGIAVGFLAGYSFLGVAWSIFKWFFYVKKKFAKGKSYGGRFKKDDPEITALHNKSRIVGWMIYWPLSFLWTLINDPIVRFFNTIYDAIQGIYQKIADKQFANYEKKNAEKKNATNDTK